MKIKTEDLTGPGLGWAVSLITNPDWEHEDRLTNVRCEDEDSYSPQTDWAQGGLIVDREIHAFDHMQSARVCAIIKRKDNRNGGWEHGYGPTVLTAAMRCYVAAKIGTEIDIPDELVAGHKNVLADEITSDSDESPR